MLRTVLFACLMFQLTSCGKSGSSLDEEVYSLRINAEQQGLFRANLRPVNPSLRSKVRGRVSVFVQEIQFYTKVKLDTRWREVTHMQAIHEGHRCPTGEDDTNRDGVVDATEVIAVAGRMMIPLDGDLRSRKARFQVFPTSDNWGSYLYWKSVSLIKLMRDLRSGPLDQYPHFGSLGPFEKLSLTQRVVIIYGIPQNIRLPSTARGFYRFPLFMSIPIACGKLHESSDPFP